MSFFKWFVTCSIVSLHGLVVFVAYEQRAKTVWLNKKINALYRTHRLGVQSNRSSKVLKCYKNPPLLKQPLPVMSPMGPEATKAPPCQSPSKMKLKPRINL